MKRTELLVAVIDGQGGGMGRALTEAVKKTLDLDTEGYDDFQGDSYEDSLTRMWSLQWSGAGGSLTVEAPARQITRSAARMTSAMS